MSDKQEKLTPEQQVDLIADKSTDLSPLQLERVNKFIEEGLPGIATLKDTDVYRMMDMYLSGKSYTQISRICNTSKDIVLYLSYKTDWYKHRQEYLLDLNNNLQDRLLETQLISQNFLTDLVHFWHKKIGNKVNKYLSTGDETAANDISMKDIDKYLKTIEVLQKMMDSGKGGGSSRVPAVGLNMGEDGVTVEKISDSKVEITPKSKTIGTVLSKLASLRREEQEKQENKNDSKNK